MDCTEYAKELLCLAQQLHSMGKTFTANQLVTGNLTITTTTLLLAFSYDQIFSVFPALSI